jgi:hypothetical protein
VLYAAVIDIGLEEGELFILANGVDDCGDDVDECPGVYNPLAAWSLWAAADGPVPGAGVIPGRLEDRGLI